MRDFFRGWRRKVGCVTLLMACVFMGMWVRSRVVVESMLFPTGKRVHAVVLAPGRFVWVSSITDYENGFQWDQLPITEFSQTKLQELEDDCRRSFSENAQGYLEFRFSLLPVAISLTILSAYLILWKPRKRVPTTPTN